MNSRLPGWLVRFVAVTFVAGPVFTLYLFIDRHQAGTPAVVTMPSWVTFSPPFIVPYFVMLLASWFLPVAIRDDGRFRACLVAYACAYLLVMPWWILTPTTLPRPALPEGAWSICYQVLWSVDPPHNVMPCAHGIGPMVAAWFIIQDRPAWKWPLIALLLVGLPSIALTWQHRPVDILLGLLAGCVGIIVGESVRRRTLERNRR